MIADDLSTAVVTYIWGNHKLPWPSERPESLSEQQLVHMPKIKSVLAAAFANDAPVHKSLTGIVTHVQSALRVEHPELTEEALRAVADYVSYCWK